MSDYHFFEFSKNFKFFSSIQIRINSFIKKKDINKINITNNQNILKDYNIFRHSVSNTNIRK